MFHTESSHLASVLQIFEHCRCRADSPSSEDFPARAACHGYYHSLWKAAFCTWALERQNWHSKDKSCTQNSENTSKLPRTVATARSSEPFSQKQQRGHLPDRAVASFESTPWCRLNTAKRSLTSRFSVGISCVHSQMTCQDVDACCIFPTPK